MIITTEPQIPYSNTQFRVWADLDWTPSQSDTPLIAFYINYYEQSPRVPVDHRWAFIDLALPSGSYIISARLYYDDAPQAEGIDQRVDVYELPTAPPPPPPPPTDSLLAETSAGGTAGSPGYTANPSISPSTNPSQAFAPPPTTGLDAYTGQPGLDPFTGQPKADPFTAQPPTPSSGGSAIPQSVRDLVYNIYGQVPPGPAPLPLGAAEPGMSIEQWIGNWTSDILGSIGTSVTQGLVTATESIVGAAELSTSIGYAATSTAIEYTSEVLRPVFAGAQIIGGTAEVIGGTLFAAVTAESGVGFVAGVATAAHGFDQLIAGIQNLSGENAETLTYKAIHDLTYALTDSEIAARATGLVVDTVAGFAGGEIASQGFASFANPLLSANSTLVRADFTGSIEAFDLGAEAITATSASSARIEMATAEAAELSQLQTATGATRIEMGAPPQFENAVPILGPDLSTARPLASEAIFYPDSLPSIPLWERGDFAPRIESTAYITSGDGNLLTSGGTPTVSETSLPVFVVDWANPEHQNLADNIWQALAAGHPSQLDYMGDRAAAALNRGASTYGIPRILSRDEYPFASTLQGGGGAWIGHIPASENSAQGGMLSQFYRRNSPNGDPFTFRVTVINHPRGPTP